METTRCPLCETPTAPTGDDMIDHLVDHGVDELAAWIAENNH